MKAKNKQLSIQYLIILNHLTIFDNSRLDLYPINE